jgi:radical SAM superfamily enzyme YgiQ (UPF0313 family)
MSIVLINPNLVFHQDDPYTTGIVYMPIGLAYLGAALRAAEYPVHVIDAFAEKPEKIRREGNLRLLGLDEKEVIARMPPDVEAVFVYAINLTNHISTVRLVHAAHEAKPGKPIIVVENTQAVSAYALRDVAEEFYREGADYILTGEPEERGKTLIAALRLGTSKEALRSIDGLGSPHFYNPPRGPIENLDSLPFPAWDLFPIASYWALCFAHGPVESDKYLTLLTSRGCPYPCRFCVVPATNGQKWRPRSYGNVVDELEFFSRGLGVREFHIEDLDPTISDQRIRDMCNEILRRKLDVIWKIAAGTKVETIRNDETIDLMAKAGCRYISISPETGSPRLLQIMRKPFDLDHAVRIVKRMNKVGIRSQACFVLGYPGETDEDLQKTRKLVRDLTRQGVDEVALFIITPVPGSAIFHEFRGYGSLSELNFSPTWRPDYRHLSQFRLWLYLSFLWWKLKYHPLKILRQPLNYARRRFETKMEMVPYRAAVFKRLDKHGSAR